MFDISIGDVDLADSSAGDIVSEYRVNGQTVTQIIEYARASAAKPINRGQNSARVTFTTTRKFATPALAAKFLGDHEKAIVAEAATSLAITIADADPQTLNNSVVVGREGRMNGCTTYHNYTVLGGKFA